jgi:pimeloyl-ACP methyl ester carboxylesterase
MNSLAIHSPTQFAEIANQKIAYRTFGSGTPLLFANRFRGIMDTWDPFFLNLLAENNRVVTFDYPGIGDSEGSLPMDMKEIAATIIQLANHLGIEQFNVLGWSYGGLVAQYLTFLYPERVLKTIIIGSNPPGKNEIPFEPAFFEKALKPVNDLEDEIVLFFEPLSEKSRKAAFESHKRIAQRLDKKKIPATQDEWQRYFAASQKVKEDVDNYRSAYQTLKNPVLVVSGDHDISFALENWFPLLRKAHTMQLIVIPEAGHGPQHQNPKLIAGYIRNFLEVEN